MRVCLSCLSVYLAVFVSLCLSVGLSIYDSGIAFFIDDCSNKEIMFIRSLTRSLDLFFLNVRVYLSDI